MEHAVFIKVGRQNMKLTKCEVGMFKLPGIIVSADEGEELTEEKLNEIEEWCKSEQGTGTRMTGSLWSFRKESQREWFILKWS